MKIKINKVKKEDQYKGAYKRIFDILNRDRIFSEVYETDGSIGWENGSYYLEISETPDADLIDEISKIKNVEILK